MPIKKSPEQLQQTMEKLQSSFLVKLRGKAELLTGISQQLESGNLTTLPQLISETHQLAGSCGTFQFNHLGVMARQIETIASSIGTSDKLQGDTLKNLIDSLKLFVNNVEQALSGPTDPLKHHIAVTATSQDVWLVLSPSALRNELCAQLHAFGYPVKTFSTFLECIEALRLHTPALLFSEAKLADELLFDQKEIIETIDEHKRRLMIYSASDSFDLRINSVRHKAHGYFVSPLDIPSMMQRITRLFDDSTLSDKKVSILDDDLLLAEHYSWVLESAGIEVQVIKDSRLVIPELLSFKPDVLLLDMHMPEFSGAEISGVIRQYESLSSLHIAFLSAERDIQLQLQALSFGADDFIAKPISNENLVTAVKSRLSRNRDIRSLIERDSLTGLVKHGTIKDAVFVEFDRMRRSGEHFCIAMIDLDHFKSVNDSYGHAIGDVVIGTIATLLRKRLRRSDKAGRYGGEEFMVVLPKCSAKDAKLLIESILRSFRDIHFSAGQQSFSSTFSAGIACSSSGYADADMMMKVSDQELYNAKRGGRNRVCVTIERETNNAEF
ncbi:MAG: diguanylate cyclase [Pararheinheimera sp.]|nr:diguanylate cyclase [Rheinheimera sp.]